MYLTELSVHVNDRLSLEICLESLFNYFLSIINSSRCLSSTHASLELCLFRDFIENDSLAFHDVLLKVNGTINSYRESIDEIVL